MKETKENDRRKFLKATGGALLAAGSVGVLQATGQHHKTANFVGSGDPLGSATVSFGGWMTSFTPPLDRFTNPLPPPPTNHHELIPNVAKIKAGGYVNFVISGLHIVAIYDGGTTPADIAASIVAGNTLPLGGILPPIVNDSNRRVYRGINPVSFPGAPGTPPTPPVFNPDRVEVVHFDTPGTYLVICALVPHFNDGMFGYVKVLSNKSSEGGE
jgi:hypothetical protein